MDMDSRLYWLPTPGEWRQRLKGIGAGERRADAWREAVALANCNLDFVQTNAVDVVVQKVFEASPPTDFALRSVRLAILGSSTFGHLHGAIRVAGLRRGIWITTYENPYGQYLQEIFDTDSGLHRFRPEVVLFAFDPYHLTHGLSTLGVDIAAHIEEIQARLVICWSGARDAFSCRIIQQAILPTLPLVLGSNESRLSVSPARVIEQVNSRLRNEAAAGTVDLLALDVFAAASGIRAWHDSALWWRTKQEVSPKKAPMYGDLVGRIVAAQAGRSFKCLVLDLDNTLWGEAIGDVGLEGIELGQGSPRGEAFVAMQEYALALANRGIVLAVCSKNDETNALAPFETHPEMVLRRNHIASFFANWDDKPANIRKIAAELNIGLDTIVFADDNPFERDLVRRELPMVAVPELGEEPSFYPMVFQDAGYFEGLTLTDEDARRTQQYQANRERDHVRAKATDLGAYLRDLKMELLWRPFDSIGMPRIVQLINKTNQFNLRTRRYTEELLREVMADPQAFGLQFRLIDRHGDNGMIAVVIGKMNREAVFIDTWLMSCRVIGRQVEEAMLGVVVAQVRRLGATSLVGEYVPTPKNEMVRDHYQRLGFVAAASSNEERRQSVLAVAQYVGTEQIVLIKQG